MRFHTFFLILITAFIFFLASCKRSDTLLMRNSNKELLIKDSILTILGYKYTDTLANNMVGEGSIKYNLNQVNIHIPANIFERRVHLYLSTSLDSNASTFKEVEKNVQWVFFDTIGSGIFNFRFKYKNIGNRTLNLAFEDLIFFGDSLQNNDTILKVKQTVIALPVFVMDSTSVLGSKKSTTYFQYERIFKVKRKDSAKFVKENQRKIDSIKRVLNNQ